MSQGRLAARNMLGGTESFDQSPFFWTVLFGKNLRYVGHSTDFDKVLFEGDLAKLNFVAFYCRKDIVEAVVTMGRDPIAVAAGELMRLGKMPTAAQLKSGAVKAADLTRQ